MRPYIARIMIDIMRASTRKEKEYKIRDLRLVSGLDTFVTQEMTDPVRLLLLARLFLRRTFCA